MNKRSIFLLTCLSILIVGISPIYAISFSDIDSHWAKDVIMRMTDKKVMNGFEDGTFRPNDNITREQFAKLLVESLNLKNSNDNIKFEDVEDGRWSQKYINVASRYLENEENNFPR